MGIAWVVAVINEVRLGINVLLQSTVVVPVGTASVTTIVEEVMTYSTSKTYRVKACTGLRH